MVEGDLVLCFDYEEIKEHGVYCYFSHYNEYGHTVAYAQHDVDRVFPIIWRYSEKG